jgi:hypothetical protein
LFLKIVGVEKLNSVRIPARDARTLLLDSEIYRRAHLVEALERIKTFDWIRYGLAFGTGLVGPWQAAQSFGVGL